MIITFRGQNNCGQIGSGTTTNQSTPRKVSAPFGGKRVGTIDPLSRPTVTSGIDHCFTCRPYVSWHFSKLLKTNQYKTGAINAPLGPDPQSRQ